MYYAPVTTSSEPGFKGTARCRGDGLVSDNAAIIRGIYDASLRGDITVVVAAMDESSRDRAEPSLVLSAWSVLWSKDYSFTDRTGDALRRALERLDLQRRRCVLVGRARERLLEELWIGEIDLHDQALTIGVEVQPLD